MWISKFCICGSVTLFIILLNCSPKHPVSKKCFLALVRNAEPLLEKERAEIHQEVSGRHGKRNVIITEKNWNRQVTLQINS